MVERTDAITNEVLEPITFVLAYPTVLSSDLHSSTMKCSLRSAELREAVQPHSALLPTRKTL